MVRAHSSFAKRHAHRGALLLGCARGAPGCTQVYFGPPGCAISARCACFAAYFRREQPYLHTLASNPLLFVEADFWPQEVVRMLWTIFVILLVLWLVGLVSSYTLGGFIHLLLVAAVVVLIIQLISGRRAAL